MASPFAAFRKNQKGLMVALVALAMFAFIIMGNGDPTAEGSELVFVLMIVCAVAGIAWGFGMRQGKGTEWASAGALAALVVIGVFWFFSGAEGYVETNAGNLSRQNVQELVDQRRIANEFLQAAYAKAVPFPTKPSNPVGDGPNADLIANFFLSQEQGEWRRQLERNLFDYGSGFGENAEAVERDVVVGFLLSQEADRLGIQVSNAAVNKFVQQVTDNRLSTEDLRAVLDQHRIGQARVMDALRAELRNRQAYQLLQPVTYTTPQEYWDIYSQLTVKQRLEATAIPVAAFVDEQAKPSEAELKGLFETYQQRQPNAEKPGDPGFVQPYKIRAGYLVVDSEGVKQSLSAPTEAEIAAHYEENKDLYRNRSIRATPHPDYPGYYLPELDDTPGPPITLPDIPSLDPPGPGDAKPEDAKPEDAKPDDTPSTPGDSKSPADDPKPNDPKPSDPKAGDTTPGDTDESSARTVPRRALLSVNDDAASAQESPADEAPAKDEEPKNDTPKEDPADPKPADPKPAADPAPSVDPDSPPATKPAATEPGPEKPATIVPDEPEFKPLDEVRDEIRRTLLNQSTRERVDELVEAAATHMSDLGARYEREILDTPNPLVLGEVHAAMVDYAKQHGLDYVTTPLYSQQDFVDSPDYPLVDAQLDDGDPRGGASVLGRLFDGADTLLLPTRARGPLGNTRFLVWKTVDVPAHYPMLATKTADPSAKLAEVGAELGFDDREIQRLFPRAGTIETLGAYFSAHFDGPIEKGQSVNLGQFKLVAAEVAGGKVTKLQLYEPGIREQVVRAWRIDKARPAAQKRAEELAKLAREKTRPAPPDDAIPEAGTELGAILAEETVTGDAKGQSLEVRETNEFSWLTRPSVPGRGVDQSGPPQLSRVAGIEGAGPQFMEKVFREMQNGDIGVVPNFDVDTFYVVKVKERSPLDPLASETLKREFMSVVKDEGDLAQGTAVYATLARNENRLVHGRWESALVERYGVKFNR